jgi:hypothetical protein
MAHSKKSIEIWLDYAKCMIIGFGNVDGVIEADKAFCFIVIQIS